MGSYTCFQFDLQNVLTGSGFHFHIKMEKASDNLDSQLGTGKHGSLNSRGPPWFIQTESSFSKYCSLFEHLVEAPLNSALLFHHNSSWNCCPRIRTKYPFFSKW